jgi:hypothetical protein
VGLALLTPLVRVLVEVIDPAGVKRGGTPLDPMHLVAILQEELRQVAAVLPCDAGDQGGFGRGCGHGGEGEVRVTAEERPLNLDRGSRFRGWWGFEGGKALAVSGQPSGEVVGALEIEQGFRQSLELLQGEGLDACSGGLAQGAAAAGQLAEGQSCTARVWCICSSTSRSSRRGLADPSFRRWWRPGYGMGGSSQTFAFNG